MQQAMSASPRTRYIPSEIVTVYYRLESLVRLEGEAERRPARREREVRG